jgi:hypothetical protein
MPTVKVHYQQADQTDVQTLTLQMGDQPLDAVKEKAINATPTDATIERVSSPDTQEDLL